MITIAPSLLSADFADLAGQIAFRLFAHKSLDDREAVLFQHADRRAVAGSYRGV